MLVQHLRPGTSLVAHGMPWVYQQVPTVYHRTPVLLHHNPVVFHWILGVYNKILVVHHQILVSCIQQWAWRALGLKMSGAMPAGTVLRLKEILSRPYT